MSDFDFDLLQEMVDEAPVAGFGPQRNFGKMVASVTVVHWDNGKVTETPFTNQKLSNGEYLRLNFESDLAEFNPVLTKGYARRVDVKKSGNKAKTDFSETVEPSLKTVLGKDWAKRITKGVYAEWEDAETVETNRQGELKGWDSKTADANGNFKHYTNTVPRFLRVFKSKAECEAARAERFAKKEPDLSFGDDGTSIPADVINNVKAFLSSVGVDQAKALLGEQAPYNSYDWDELVKAAS